MKILLALALVLSGFFVFSASIANAQDKGVVEGQKIFEKFQKKEISCSSLKDNDFEKLGDYYMDQMMGSSHEAMDQRIESVSGEEGLKNMHIVMGKRISGCGVGFMPMMWMMGSAFAPQSFGGTKGGGTNMMGWGYGNMMGFGGNWGIFSVFSLFYSILILAILVLLVVWLWKQIQKK